MTHTGLTTEAAHRYHAAHGYNEITERRQSLFEKTVRRSASPVSGMLALASLLSFVSGRDFDGVFILVLIIVNTGVAVWQEYKADTAIAKLNERLAISVKALRDGAWRVLPARLLAPGDIIEIASGNIVPADATVLDAANANANEAPITGESLPREKKTGDRLYSGSFLASGFVRARVTAIGSGTSFGKTIAQGNIHRNRSALEEDVLRIARFLSALSLVAVALLTIVLALGNSSWLDILRLDLSLIIAGIPISLSTVMTLIIALGTVSLARKNVIVRRLSSLEELANTDLLLTDKTGTLTKNHIVVHEVVAYGADMRQIRSLAALVALQEPDVLLNQAILADEAAAGECGICGQCAIVSYMPADSSRKRSTVVCRQDGRTRTVSLGAPQVIADLCILSSGVRRRFDADVRRFAKHGYRALALAAADGASESDMHLLGVFALSDEVRDDAANVIRFLLENGIEVAMVTGDNRAIAQEVANALRLPGKGVMTRDDVGKSGWRAIDGATFRKVQAFAEILPEDKLALVERARSRYTVAANGDGINDLPAVRAASVGFAVSNAVDALKGAADIVLLSPGIGVMKDAFIEGRKIFERLRTYAVYRVSESFRLILTIVVLGIFGGAYPLSSLQLILLALLNDIPIISLATDRVKIAKRPSKIHVREQFAHSLLYGMVGVINSVLLYFIAVTYLDLSEPVVQTLFFLKLTVSGHLLIYVVHTRERWWRYMPSKAVIIATTATQAFATMLALTGWLMPAPVSWQLALFVWIWALFFMQICEFAKFLFGRGMRRRERSA